MKTINLKRSPWLRDALAYICDNPGCCKADVCGRTKQRGGDTPQYTRNWRYRRIDEAIQAGLIDNEGKGFQYELYTFLDEKDY